MALSRDSRQEQKFKAIRLAEFRLKQRLEAIDWREDILIPELEAMKSGREVLGLEAGAVFDIKVLDDHSNLGHATTTDAPASKRRDPRRTPQDRRAKSARPRAGLRSRK